MKPLKPTELIINPDGAVYHLSMKPEHVADHVILVGDPGRVEVVARFFDRVEVKTSNREFTNITGYYQGTRVSVLSTGIGTDNMEIVVTELDALVNGTKTIRGGDTSHRILNLVRIGTSGSIQENIPPGSFILSESALGLDGLLHFYHDSEKVRDLELEKVFFAAIPWPAKLPVPYLVNASASLKEKFMSGPAASGFYPGITLSAPGFYAPQGRSIKLSLQYPLLNDQFSKFVYRGRKILNFEMESSLLYGLSQMLGHEALAICLVLANRATGEMVPDHTAGIEKLIHIVLDHLPFSA
jgi:uridine phosphorylase